MKRHIITIDPGHTKWCICYEKADSSGVHPTDFNYIIGKEKKGIGSPNMANALINIHCMIPPEAEIVIVIEEPRGKMNAIISLNRDVGYIAGLLHGNRQTVIVLCQASDWKKFLESKGLLPEKSGIIPPEKYCPILNKKFKLDFTDDQWAAFAMNWWTRENIEGKENNQ